MGVGAGPNGKEEKDCPTCAKKKDDLKDQNTIVNPNPMGAAMPK